MFTTTVDPHEILEAARARRKGGKQPAAAPKRKAPNAKGGNAPSPTVRRLTRADFDKAHGGRFEVHLGTAHDELDAEYFDALEDAIEFCVKTGAFSILDTRTKKAYYVTP